METRRLKRKRSPIKIDLVSLDGENLEEVKAIVKHNNDSDSGVSSMETNQNHKDKEEVKLAEKKVKIKKELHECWLCLKIFANKTNLDRHIAKMHKKNDEQGSEKLNAKIDGDANTKKVDEETRVMAVNSDNSENEDPQKYNTIKHSKNRECRSNWQCQKYCGKYFSNKANLQRHENICNVSRFKKCTGHRMVSDLRSGSTVYRCLNCAMVVKSIEGIKTNDEGTQATLDNEEEDLILRVEEVSENSSDQQLTIPSTTIENPVNNDHFDLECNCGKKFMIYKDLKAHLETCVAERPSIFRCRIYCNKVFTDTWDRADHEKLCCIEEKKKNSQICYMCYKICIDLEDLDKHLRRKHKDVPYQCRKCGEEFQDYEGLKMHHKNGHLKITNSNSQVQDFSIQIKKISTNSEISHTIRESSNIIKDEKNSVINDNLVEKPVTNDHFDLECNCGEKFKYYKRLKIHLETCVSKRPSIFRCRIYCNKVFTDTWDRADHEKICSIEEKKEDSYICYVCFKICKDTNDLNKHLRRIHPGDFFSCRKCGKICSSHYRLGVHYVFVHKKTLECRKYCDSFFSTENSRTIHEEKCLPEELRKKYLCYVCFKICYSSAQVNKHINKYHDLMQCKKCYHVLSSYDELKHHYIKFHKGAQKCRKGCEMEFKNETKLIKHEQACEAAKKPKQTKLICRVCFKVCSNKVMLHQHIQNTHKVFKCGKCNYVSEAYKLLAQHYRCSHLNFTNTPGKVKELKDTISLSDGSEMDENENVPIAKCRICNAKLPNMDNLRRHMERTHPGVRIKYYSSNEDTSDFYKCTKCFKAFKFKTALKLHRDKYHPQKWFPHPKYNAKNSEDAERTKIRKKRSPPKVQVTLTIDPKDCKICAFLNTINLKHSHHTIMQDGA